jgi:glycosyltransferase XagB
MGMPQWGYANEDVQCMTGFELFIVVFSLLLTTQAAHAAWLMLYAWEDPNKLARNQAPKKFIKSQNSFTILLPARHEESVIQGTIQRMVDLNYPRELVQILIIIEGGDHGTITKVNEKLDDLRRKNINNAKLITFDDPPINKPHGLNVGLKESTGDVMVIFDAEDEPHPQILNLINTVMVQEDAPVVQSGVQLMNYADHWFSALNVLEYFFWFKSRLHFHATIGSVPLGGNTIFIRRELLQYVNGWDQNNLTEDAELGIRLSAAGVPIRVVYDDQYVTREETPPSVSQLVKQRTRWTQGFLQVLAKGTWMGLPTLAQRVMAMYTLSFPLFQALLMLYVPFSLYLMFFVKMPELVAMITTLPLYMIVIHYVISVIGLYEFVAAHGLKRVPLMPIKLLIWYLPYQWILNFSSLRALWRFVRGINNWEKTVHTGALRKDEVDTIPKGHPTVANAHQPVRVSQSKVEVRSDE